LKKRKLAASDDDVAIEAKLRRAFNEQEHRIRALEHERDDLRRRVETDSRTDEHRAELDHMIGSMLDAMVMMRKVMMRKLK
jgi:hypothetical protein